MQQHLRYDEVNYCYDAHATLENMVEHVSWEDASSEQSEEEDHDAYLLLEGMYASPSALEADYYYDTHPQLEDHLMEGSPHSRLVHYLMDVLQWRYEGQVCVLHGNLGIYQGDQHLLVPDLCVFKGRAYEPILSWKIGQTGPPPQVVFEIASQGTWERDVDDKPRLYAQMGVKEYFVYDPAMPPVMTTGRRLLGWKRNSDGEMKALVRHKGGWLWSQQLESYLGADGTLLRLYDNQGQRRLTKAEALEQENDALAEDNDTLEQEKRTLAQKHRLAERRAVALEQRAQTLAQEKQRVEQEKQLAEQRAQASEQEKRLAEQRAQASEQEKRLAEQRAQALAEKLRALGINPDE